MTDEEIRMQYRFTHHAFHHAENALEEAKYLSAELSEAADRLTNLCLKIRNRLMAETSSDR